MKSPASPKPRLSVRHLSVHFRPRGLLSGLRSGRVLAVDDLHLDLKHGETIGFVGESGCGKSTLARALAGLLEPATGSIRCDGEELAGKTAKDAAALGRAIQLVGETPLAEFKPRRRAGDIVAEPLASLAPKPDTRQREDHVGALLRRVGLPEEVAQKQLKALGPDERARVALARALCVTPKVLLCDMPDARLSEAERESFVERVVELARQMDLALILFAQEPSTLRRYCSRLVTMTLGKIMEQAPTDALLDAPRHPYTRALLEKSAAAEETAGAAGAAGGPRGAKPLPPPLQHPPMGCVFHPRCPLAEAACVRSEPHLRRVGAEHYAACHFLGDSGQMPFDRK